MKLWSSSKQLLLESTERAYVADVVSEMRNRFFRQPNGLIRLFIPSICKAWKTRSQASVIASKQSTQTGMPL